MTDPFSPPLRIAPRGPRVAVICADWSDDHVAQTRSAAIDELNRSGPADIHVDAFEVREAADIPMLAKKLARSGRYAALLACGSVTRAVDAVSGSVVDALMRVQLETTVPVFSAVLGASEFQRHSAHRRFFADHFIRRGQDVALTCLDALPGAQPSPAKPPLAA